MACCIPASTVHPRIPTAGAHRWSLAGFSAKALANAERQLSEELSGPVGRVLPAPLDSLGVDDADGNSPLSQLVGDLANLKGGTAIVPSMAKDWADVAGGSAPNWNTRRIGAEPPLSVVQARGEGHNHLLASCGVPPGLFETRDAGAARESLRMFLHTTVSPWARVLETEARDKLNAAVTLDFVALHASDVMGRARAARALVQAGFSLAEAAARVASSSRRHDSDRSVPRVRRVWGSIHPGGPANEAMHSVPIIGQAHERRRSRVPMVRCAIQQRMIARVRSARIRAPTSTPRRRRIPCGADAAGGHSSALLSAAVCAIGASPAPGRSTRFEVVSFDTTYLDSAGGDVWVSFPEVPIISHQIGG